MKTSYTELSDLIKKLQSGDVSVFEEIYNLTYERVYFTALKICKSEDDAEDVVQEAYIYLMNKANEIKNPDAFISWFNMVVASKAKNLLRKNSPVLFDSNETEQFVLESIEDTDKDFQPSADYEQSELRDEVMGLIDNLSDEKRTAVILFYYNEMTTKQIAESLNVNENTIKSRLVQAKKDLTKGVKELEKRNGKLLGVAPIPVILWAMRSSATKTAEAFTVSGGAATTYTAIITASAIPAAAVASTAGAATAGGVVAKIAGLSVAQKIISGVVVAGIVTGGAVGANKAIQHSKENREKPENPTSAVQAAATTTEPEITGLIVTTKPEITTTSSPDKTTATTIPQTTIKTVPEDEKQTTKITAAPNKPEANSTSKALAKTTTEATTKTETVNLNVNWESFSGDGKTGSYIVEVAKGTNITKSLVSGQVPSIYSTVDISKGNEYINTSAENSSYNFELFVY